MTMGCTRNVAPLFLIAINRKIRKGGERSDNKQQHIIVKTNNYLEKQTDVKPFRT